MSDFHPTPPYPHLSPPLQSASNAALKIQLGTSRNSLVLRRVRIRPRSSWRNGMSLLQYHCGFSLLSKRIISDVQLVHYLVLFCLGTRYTKIISHWGIMRLMMGWVWRCTKRCWVSDVGLRLGLGRQVAHLNLVESFPPWSTLYLRDLYCWDGVRVMQVEHRFCFTKIETADSVFDQKWNSKTSLWGLWQCR